VHFTGGSYGIDQAKEYCFTQGFKLWISGIIGLLDKRQIKNKSRD